jgi:hypothetical protein
MADEDFIFMAEQLVLEETRSLEAASPPPSVRSPLSVRSERSPPPAESPSLRRTGSPPVDVAESLGQVMIWPGIAQHI